MIQVQNLVKHYGTLRAVDGINFTVNDGEIVGFLGPNGAGKSTTLKIVTGYLTPSGGNVQVDSLNITDHSREIRKKIGYLPEHNPLYTEMTVYDFLKFIADVREIQPDVFKQTLKKVIGMTGLGKVINRPIDQLSKGYRQRVGLAQALIHDPEILILDEPTNGLDPNQIVENRELLKQLGRTKTIIFCSHNLLVVEAVCSRVILISNGQIVANDSIPNLKKELSQKLGGLDVSFEDVFQYLTLDKLPAGAKAVAGSQPEQEGEVNA